VFTAIYETQIEIYDTTLRDGSQGEGINFSVADKLRIAEKLDSSGFTTLKVAGRAPIQGHRIFCEARRRNSGTPNLLLWFHAKKNTPVEQTTRWSAHRAENAGCHHYGKTSLLHVKEVLRCTPEENLAMIADT